MLVWFALVSTAQVQESVAGIVICLGLAAFLYAGWLQLGLPPLSAKRIVFFLIYLVVPFWEIVKANFDVAFRVVHPKMPIRPGIVIIETGLKSDIAKMILANSITLTPGTFTVDVAGDKLLIHWMNVRAEDLQEASRRIGERFERYLRVIFL